MTPHVEASAVRVRYAETDAQGVVHHAAYVPWLEIGRIEFCRSIGIDYRALEAQGFFLAVVSLSVTYRAPAYFDDQLTVLSRLFALRRSSLVFHYEILRDQPAQKLTEAEVTLVCLNREKHPVPIPPAFREKFASAQGTI